MIMPYLDSAYAVIATSATTQPTAWSSSGYVTVLLCQDLPRAMRVHARGRIPGGSSTWGRWLSIDLMERWTTRLDFIDRHALERDAAWVSFFTLRAGTVLNVGWAAPLFSRAGGAAQAEFVEHLSPQPLLEFDEPGFWTDCPSSALWQ